VTDLDGIDASLLARDLDVRPYRQAFVVVVDRELTRAGVAQLVRERLGLAPRFEQIVAGWPAPKWTPDDGFDVMGHVRETTLPAGQTIESWIEQRLGLATDRDHPLWQLWLLRLPGDRHALVMLAHPALGRPAHLLDVLLDGASAGPVADVAAGGPVEALATGVGAMVDSAWRTVSGHPAPCRVAGVAVALADVQAVARASGCCVRDVAFTLVAEGLARALPTEHDPITWVPVAGRGHALALPVGVPDTYSRLIQLASMAETWDASADEVPAAAAQARAARTVVGAPRHQVLLAGVGELPEAARIGTARVLGLTAFTTPADDEEVTVNVTACAGQVFFGAAALWALDGFGSGVQAGLARLVTHVGKERTR